MLKLFAIVISVLIPCYEAGIKLEHGRIGIRINDSTHRIVRVYKGSPAALAGIQAGDKILKCDGKNAWSITDGCAGERVTLLIEHRWMCINKDYEPLFSRQRYKHFEPTDDSEGWDLETRKVGRHWQFISRKEVVVERVPDSEISNTW